MKLNPGPSALAASLSVAGILISSPAFAAAGQVRAEGDLLAYSSELPAGATARVQAVYTPSGQTVVTLHVEGLKPGTDYGAHAHVGLCAAGVSAGGHYQFVQGGATDPAFANQDNEIWLDFTTDETGAATSQTKVSWTFPADRRAKSVVVHAHHTHTGPTDSGVAGARLGCLGVDF